MQIDEYHKVQKIGLSVEGCQIQCVEKMTALVAVLSVVAVGLMNLRLELWIQVLSRIQTGRGHPEWTVEQFWVQLARLGGYQKNPKTHPPGWITLWRGWQILHTLIRYETRSTPKMS